jgi:hypothetical protein
MIERRFLPLISLNIVLYPWENLDPGLKRTDALRASRCKLRRSKGRLDVMQQIGLLEQVIRW